VRRQYSTLPPYHLLTHNAVSRVCLLHPSGYVVSFLVAWLWCLPMVRPSPTMSRKPTSRSHTHQHTPLCCAGAGGRAGTAGRGHPQAA
jgi:hypothetical protein